jgi:hypothetical protein
MQLGSQGKIFLDFPNRKKERIKEKMKHLYIYFYNPMGKYCLFHVDRSRGEYSIIKVFDSKFSAVIYGKVHGLTVNN